MGYRPLIEAWLALAALSAATTLLTLTAPAGPRRLHIAAAVLALAGLKARLILGRYLGLSSSRFWTATFDLAVGAFLVVAFGLVAAGG